MENATEKLEEFVLDEDKVVTISSFASEAHISLADAKDVLKKYVDANKSSGKIHTTYILNGKKKKDKQNYVTMVKDTDLEAKRQLFEDNVIETVFSIQKSDKIDFNLIVLGDPINENPLPGSIVSRNCTKRVIKKKVLPPTPVPQAKTSIFGKQSSTKSEASIRSEKPSIFANQNRAKSENSIKSETSETVSSNAKPEAKPKSSQGGIANMFSKMSQNKSDEGSKPKEEKSKPKNASISGFLTKISSSTESIEAKKGTKPEENIISPKRETITLKKEKESPKEEIIKGEEKVNKKEDLFDSDSNEEVEQMMMKMDVAPIKEGKPKKIEKKPIKKRRAKNAAENSQSAKRRKRIVVADDSDSDDIFDSPKEDEDNGLSEPEEEPVEEVVKKPLPPKNKRRKAVDKTYQDEEGFIVTRTEYIYETASEDEVEEAPKKATQEKPNLVSKKSTSSNSDMDIVDGTPQKGKGGKKGAKKNTGNQPTLMSFFTKK